ncbi:MAG: stage II sporulation protein M [Lachnospiraceae bacterium]|nr:stage II sporulation protein M [Lachnospiraceae bacterium]
MMRKQNPFLWLFIAGAFIGIVVLNREKSAFLQNTGIWDADMIERIASLSLGGGTLFWTVLAKRGGRFLGITILSTTYLGRLTCVFCAFGYGFFFGGYVAAAVMRHGIKGILLALLGIFPQGLLYGPMFYGLLLWCSQNCDRIYGRRTRAVPTGNRKAPALAERMLSWLCLVVLLLAGCALESFLSPKLLAAAVKLM